MPRSSTGARRSKCDQHRLSATVIFLARECCMSGRKLLQGFLPSTFLVLAWQMPVALPGAWLDNLYWDRTQCDGRFDRADCSAVFETRRHALLRHRLCAFDQSADRFVPIDEVTDGGNIDAFFGAGTNDRNIAALHQYRGGSVGNLDDSQSAANTRINA